MGKNRKKSDKLSKDFIHVYGKNKILIDRLRQEFDFLKETYNLSDQDVFKIIKKKEIIIPVSIFNNKLAPLEALVLYLKDSYRLSEIAAMLNRDQGTIWLTYQNALKKRVRVSFDSDVFVPVRIFSERRLSVLESLTEYLREDGLSLKEIAGLVGKDNRTIWTVYSRAKKKRGR
ncbi:hypothetical protein HQ529_03245 [Candidatus Woesearchaeota archaeon]|nr:hypothetical protein [Candidatus Woesearchaeota archaeon]